MTFLVFSHSLRRDSQPFILPEWRSARTRPGHTCAASDPDSEIIDAFGIRNHDQKPGTTGYGIPNPGIMVFDADDTLVAKFAEKSDRKRPRVDDLPGAPDKHMAKAD